MAEKTMDIERDIEALRAILAALEPLDEAGRTRVLGLVGHYYGSPPSLRGGEAGEPKPPPPVLQQRQDQVTDIRAVKEQKRPGSAVEMAALVAYYLTELAPPSERSSTLTRSLLTKYFKQAGYPLPQHPNMTLVNAKNAGYLDATNKTGSYVLNPVGYNLAAHGLPRKSGDGPGTVVVRSRREAKKGRRPKSAVGKSKSR